MKTLQKKDPVINKLRNHHHFWIEDEMLYETYKTIRGLRYMEKMAVPGMPNEQHCSEACMIYIAKEYK